MSFPPPPRVSSIKDRIPNSSASSEHFTSKSEFPHWPHTFSLHMVKSWRAAFGMGHIKVVKAEESCWFVSFYSTLAVLSLLPVTLGEVPILCHPLAFFIGLAAESLRGMSPRQRLFGSSWILQVLSCPKIFPHPKKMMVTSQPFII